MVVLLATAGQGSDHQSRTGAMPHCSTEVNRSRVLPFRGALTDRAGKAVTGVVGVMFAIYRDQEGGAAVWQEVQNVNAGLGGDFTVTLGATKNDGIDCELFEARNTRWLGIQVLLPDEEELPRLRLVANCDGLTVERATKLIILAAAERSPANTALQRTEDAYGNGGNEAASAAERPRLRRGFHRWR